MKTESAPVSLKRSRVTSEDEDDKGGVRSEEKKKHGDVAADNEAVVPARTSNGVYFAGSGSIETACRLVQLGLQRPSVVWQAPVTSAIVVRGGFVSCCSARHPCTIPLEGSYLPKYLPDPDYQLQLKINLTPGSWENDDAYVVFNAELSCRVPTINAGSFLLDSARAKHVSRVSKETPPLLFRLMHSSGDMSRDVVLDLREEQQLLADCISTPVTARDWSLRKPRPDDDGYTTHSRLLTYRLPGFYFSYSMETGALKTESGGSIKTHGCHAMLDAGRPGHCYYYHALLVCGVAWRVVQ